MGDLFVLRNVSKPLTRKECDTIGKDIGDKFLKNFYGCHKPEYAGHIVYKGDMVPFWRVCCGMTDIIQERARIELFPEGYIGEIIKE